MFSGFACFLVTTCFLPDKNPPIIEFSLFSIKCIDYIKQSKRIDAPLLTDIIIGDVNDDENAHNFMNVAVINIECTFIFCLFSLLGMDSLQRLLLGNHSFPNTKDLYLNRYFFSFFHY